jgi:hypothetical protein
MGASFNQFKNHIWGPYLSHGKYLLMRTIHSKKLQYSTIKLETRAPIKLCALRV